MNWKYNFDIVCAFTGGVLTYLFGGLDIFIKVLCAFMIIDYITGVTASFIDNQWNSETGFKGTLKKCTILIMVIMAVFIDRLLNIDSFIIRNAVTSFIIANEGISILENMGRIGIPIPIRLKQALEQLKKEGEEDA